MLINELMMTNRELKFHKYGEVHIFQHMLSHLEAVFTVYFAYIYNIKPTNAHLFNIKLYLKNLLHVSMPQ